MSDRLYLISRECERSLRRSRARRAREAQSFFPGGITLIELFMIVVAAISIVGFLFALRVIGA